MKKLFLSVALAAMSLASFAASAVSQAAVSVGSTCVAVKDAGVDLVAKAAFVVGGAINRALFEYMAGNGMVLGLTTKSTVYTGVLPVRTQPIQQDVIEVPVVFDMPVAAPAAGDILALVKVPPGVEIVDYVIITDDCDSGAGLTFTFGSLNAGLTAIATAYLAAQTTLQTGGLVRAASAAHWLESNAAERSLGLTFPVIAAGYQTGKKGLLVLSLRG